jgi:Na+/serine symporter
MPSLEFSLSVVTFMAAFAAGTVSILWPKRVESHIRNHHTASPLTQHLLLSGALLKFCDCKYFLPGMGVVAWSVALGVAYVSIFSK